MNELRNQVVRVGRFGGPDGLEVVDAPFPTAGRGEVRVRVLASGLEYTDVLIRRHLYPQTMRRRPPFVLGYDVVGEIDQLGGGATGVEETSQTITLTNATISEESRIRTIGPTCRQSRHSSIHSLS